MVVIVVVVTVVVVTVVVVQQQQQQQERHPYYIKAHGKWLRGGWLNAMRTLKELIEGSKRAAGAWSLVVTRAVGSGKSLGEGVGKGVVGGGGLLLRNGPRRYAVPYGRDGNLNAVQRCSNRGGWRGFSNAAARATVDKVGGWWSLERGLWKGATRGVASLRQPLMHLISQPNLGASFTRGPWYQLSKCAYCHGARASSLTEGLSGGQRRALSWWLGGSAAWVFSMVVLGGVTRLTRSGLSMTDWKFTGERPPQSQEEWEKEFAKYKHSPEFKRVNISMSLEEFKFIYWMEWAHRMWGRGLGIAFLIPFAIFAASGAITKPMASRLGLLFIMGGTQAFVGWWMVKSGLQEPESPHQIPRVSPYRLASHLTSAFAIYALMVWTTLSTAIPQPLSSRVSSAQSLDSLVRLRSVALPFAGLLGITALSGAFVAGLDAGHAYNTFPFMDGKLIPEEYWALDGWRNAFENTAAVQFHHRALAITTLLGSLSLWKYGTGLNHLPKSPRMLLHALAIGTGLQVALGITTLLHYVPVSLGAAHQAGALSLFTVSLGLLHTLRPSAITPLGLSLAKYGTPTAAALVVGIGGAAALSSA